MASESASEGPIVSRDRVIEIMRQQLRLAIKVRHRFTYDSLAEQSGVDVRVIRSWMSNDANENREPKLSAALSVAVVLGRPAINAILAVIGFVAEALEDQEGHQPAVDAAEMMAEVAEFAKCAATGRIDHTKEELAATAADNVIELALPYSHKGHAA